MSGSGSSPFTFSTTKSFVAGLLADRAAGVFRRVHDPASRRAIGARHGDGDARTKHQAERDPRILADVGARIHRGLRLIHPVVNQLADLSGGLVDFRSVGLDLLLGSFNRGRGHRSRRLMVGVCLPSVDRRMQNAGATVTLASATLP
jgi:hypothetical protein